MSRLSTPEEPKGIGSIIRVVFKEPGACDPETFYVGVAPGRWVEYGSEGVDEFTWKHMSQIISFDEADEFEVVYEGVWATKMYDDTHQLAEDLFWRKVL